MKETGRLILHNIPSNISETDIRIYLEAQLSDIAQSFSLPSSWPVNEDVVRLVKQSAGLFIFAATASKFIADRGAHDPKQQLTILMSTTYVASGNASPHRELDSLYLRVLHEAFPNISGGQRARLKTILGTVILLFDPLDPEGLEALLDLDEGTVRMTLCSLHSIIIVPEVGDGSVRLIHPSVHDFLVDDDRCSDRNFAVRPQLQHTLLAQHCLRVLQDLSQDMCKIMNPSICNQEVTDLPARIATYIPAHVQYACRYWASHLSSGDIHDTMLDLLLQFCSKQLVNWVSVMSLLGELNGTITALQLARRKVQVRSGHVVYAISADKHCWSDNRKSHPRRPRL